MNTKQLTHMITQHDHSYIESKQLLFFTEKPSFQGHYEDVKRFRFKGRLHHNTAAEQKE